MMTKGLGQQQQQQQFRLVHRVLQMHVPRRKDSFSTSSTPGTRVIADK